MEKLQAAVEKARLARNQEEIKSRTPPRAATSDRNPQTDRDALWAALKPFELADTHLLEHRIVTRDAGPSAVPFDILRTKVLLQMRQNGWKRLAITSQDECSRELHGPRDYHALADPYARRSNRSTAPRRSSTPRCV